MTEEHPVTILQQSLKSLACVGVTESNPLHSSQLLKNELVIFMVLAEPANYGDQLL